MLRRNVWLKLTNISEVLTASIDPCTIDALKTLKGNAFIKLLDMYLQHAEEYPAPKYN